MTRFLSVSAFLAALFCVAEASIARSAESAVQDPVVAKVDGQTILLSEVADAFSRIPPQYQQLPVPTLFSAIVDNLINTRLTAAAARKEKMNELPEVKEQMMRVESEILQRLYLAKAIDDNLTDAAVKKRYDEISKNLKGEEQISARHILVDSEALAKDVIAQLGRKADFVELAKKHSKGPSAAKGGDLGFFTRDAMVPEFSAAAFALKDGEYTQRPVKTQFGWHVIKVDGRRLSDPPSFDQIRPKLESDMAQEMGARTLEDLRKGSSIERFEIDPAVFGKMLAQ